MSEDNAPIVHTIKHGKGFEDSWNVFRGTADEIRANAIALYGVKPELVEGMSTAVVLEAIRQSAQRGIFKPHVLDAMFAAAHDAMNNEVKPVTSLSCGTVEDVLEAVRSAGSVAEVEAVWAENKSLWDARCTAEAKARKEALNA